MTASGLTGNFSETRLHWIEAISTSPLTVTTSRYRLLSLLGKGSFGAVYRAHDATLQRVVALKLFETIGPESGELYERLTREALVLGRLTHPNIVALYDAGPFGDGSYIAMELLVGEDLKCVVEARGKIPLGEACRWLAPVADGLLAVHAAGYIHRDVKPANVVLCGDGRAVLTDFGLVLIDEATRLTRPGYAVGTPRYAPPEILVGLDSGPAHDVYSLALTLHELVTGLPYWVSTDCTAETPDGRRPAGTLPELYGDLPEELVELQSLALSPVVTERPTMEEYRDALLAFPVHQSEVAARELEKSTKLTLAPPPPTSRSLTPRSVPVTLPPTSEGTAPRTGPTVVAGTLALVAVVVVAFLGLRASRNRPPPVAASVSATVTAPAARTPLVHDLTVLAADRWCIVDFDLWRPAAVVASLTPTGSEGRRVEFRAPAGPRWFRHSFAGLVAGASYRLDVEAGGQERAVSRWPVRLRSLTGQMELNLASIQLETDGGLAVFHQSGLSTVDPDPRLEPLLAKQLDAGERTDGATLDRVARVAAACRSDLLARLLMGLIDCPAVKQAPRRQAPILMAAGRARLPEALDRIAAAIPVIVDAPAADRELAAGLAGVGGPKAVELLDRIAWRRPGMVGLIEALVTADRTAAEALFRQWSTGSRELRARDRTATVLATRARRGLALLGVGGKERPAPGQTPPPLLGPVATPQADPTGHEVWERTRRGQKPPSWLIPTLAAGATAPTTDPGRRLRRMMWTHAALVSTPRSERAALATRLGGLTTDPWLGLAARWAGEGVDQPSFPVAPPRRTRYAFLWSPDDSRLHTGLWLEPGDTVILEAQGPWGIPAHGLVAAAGDRLEGDDPGPRKKGPPGSRRPLELEAWVGAHPIPLTRQARPALVTQAGELTFAVGTGVDRTASRTNLVGITGLVRVGVGF